MIGAMPWSQEFFTVLDAIGSRSVLHMGHNREPAEQMKKYCKGAKIPFFSPDLEEPKDREYATLSVLMHQYDTICMDAHQNWSVLYELLLHGEECMKEFGVHPAIIFLSVTDFEGLQKAAGEFLKNSRYELFVGARANAAIMASPLLLTENKKTTNALAEIGWKHEDVKAETDDTEQKLQKAEARIRFLQSVREKEGIGFGHVWQEFMAQKEAVQSHLKAVEENREKIMQSKSWKITAPLRRTEGCLRRLLGNRLRKENPEDVQKDTSHARGVDSPVAVVIPCHNYGKYLAKCIESVLHQTLPPQEIVVVDDASEDSTPAVAKAFEHKGVRYLRGEWHSAGKARNAGAASTEAPYLIFLDADDVLGESYIEKCLETMQDPAVGIAYAHHLRFGARNFFINVPEYDKDEMMKRNYISSHAMIRRQLFDMVGGYRAKHSTHEDWDLYRRAMQFQWKAARADTHLLYRAHDDSKFYGNLKEKGWKYAERAHLHHQPITIFTPFAGRGALLDEYVDALRKLDFDPQLIRLHCFDTSGNAEFGQRLKDALASLPFGRTTYTSAPHPDHWNHTPESLIKLRMSNKRNAQYFYELAVVNAYNHFLNTCDTEFGLTVEDDILLSPKSLKMMLSTVEGDVSAVVAPYPCHINGYWLVWDRKADGTIVHPQEREEGVKEIGGSGFGCSLFRMSDLKKMPIYTRVHWQKRQWYDHLAFDHLHTQGTVLCNWDVPIEHVYTERHVGKAQGVSQ